MTKRKIPPIEKKLVRLRLLDESDLPMTLSWRNQDHIRKWFVHSDIITPEQHRAWYQRYSQLDNDYVFIIEETEKLKKPVGQVSIYNIDWTGRRGECGRLLIGESSMRGKGIATKATQLLIDDFAFETLRLERIDLVVFKNNESAIAVYRACGFQEFADENHMKYMVKFRQ